MPQLHHSTTILSPLKLHTLGYSPIPLGKDKRPLVKWERFQTVQCSPDELTSFENMNPPAWGIATGEPYGLLVLDADTKDRADFDKLVAMFEAHGMKPTVITPSGGHHYYCTYPTGSALTIGARIMAGLDFRGTGGYVGILGTTSAGSYQPQIIPTPDNLYSWDKVPQPVKVALTTPRPSKAPAAGTAPAGNIIPEGQRHAELLRIAGRLRNAGADEAAILAQLEAENAARCVPPMPDAEVRELARDIPRRYEAGKLPERQPSQSATVEPFTVENANTEPATMDVEHLFAIDGDMRTRLLPVGQATTIFSQGGSGKSLIGADYLPLLFANGMTGDGSILTPLGMGKVLVLDWETDIETHRRYIKAIRAGMPELTLDLPVYYREMHEAITLHAAEIRHFIKENDISLIVIDSQMAAMAGAYGNRTVSEAESAGAYYNILSGFEITSLSIDHVAKSTMNGENVTGTAYGSVVKYNRARSVFELKQASEPGEPYIELAFVQTKNNLGSRLKPFGVRIDFDNDEAGILQRVTFSALDLADAGASIQKVRPLPDQVKDYILIVKRGTGATVKELAAELQRTEGTIRDVLNRRSDLFVVIGGDRTGQLWGIKAHEA